MNPSNLQPLDKLLPGDSAECNRLSRRVYELVAAWEPLIREQRRLEREFVEDDLTERDGPRRGQKLNSAGRQKRLDELLAVHQEATEIHRALEWLERRREKLLTRLTHEPDPILKRTP